MRVEPWRSGVNDAVQINGRGARQRFRLAFNSASRFAACSEQLQPCQGGGSDANGTDEAWKALALEIEAVAA
jgi:hypothetical protein